MEVTLANRTDEQDAALALESRYCLFEVDGGSSKLGQRNQNGTDTRTKATHAELFGAGIIGKVSSLAYGTWDGQRAALLVLILSLRGRENGPLRFRSAEFSIKFRAQAPSNNHPIVRSVQPINNQASIPAAASTSTPNPLPSSFNVGASYPSALWPGDRFAIQGRMFTEKSCEEPSQVVWNVKFQTGICESTIPVVSILTFSDPFVGIVRAKAKTSLRINLQSFPWSTDDPLLFDGKTPKGKGVAGTDFSRLGEPGPEQRVLDWLNSSLTQEHLSASSTPVATGGSVQPAVEKRHELAPSRHVYRVHGIPLSCPVATFVKTLSVALSVAEDTIEVKAFSKNHTREENVAVVSFSLEPTEVTLPASNGQWHFRVSSELWVSSQGPKLDVDLHFDTNFLGFTHIGMVPDPLPSFNIDIIAIHGLGGHAFGSFKQRNGHYMWLLDSLGPDLANCQKFGQRIHPRILTYGYNARVDKSQSFQSIEDLAIDLKRLLRTIREKDPGRPLIFIGHSLGGLLIKDLLIQCAEPEAEHIDSASVDATIGVLFFGVPNNGMDVTALLSIIGAQPNAEFLASLGIGSQFLAKQASLFPSRFDSRRAVIYSFYETCVSKTAKLVNGELKLEGDPVELVGKQSATHSRPWEMDNKNFVIPIQRPHADLVKFEKYSTDYEKTRDCIEDILGKRFGITGSTLANA